MADIIIIIKRLKRKEQNLNETWNWESINCLGWLIRMTSQGIALIRTLKIVDATHTSFGSRGSHLVIHRPFETMLAATVRR
jgi:hypothetical protein